jgi:hypothetical protein
MIRLWINLFCEYRKPRVYPWMNATFPNPTHEVSHLLSEFGTLLLVRMKKMDVNDDKNH